MPDATVRHLPELTEQEAMRILQNPLGEGGSTFYKVYKPETTFNGFVIQRQYRESGMKVAVCVRLVQKKAKPSFKVDTYEQSAARSWFYIFFTLFRLPMVILRWLFASEDERERMDENYLSTDYERRKEGVAGEIARFVRNVPEFRIDPAEEWGKGLEKMMKFFMKLGGYKPDDNSGLSK